MSSGIDLFDVASSKERLRFWDEQNKVYPPLTTFDEFPIVDMSPHTAIAFECPTLVVLKKLHLDSFRSGKRIYMLITEFATQNTNPLKQLKLYIERKVGAVDWRRVTFISVHAESKNTSWRSSMVKEIVLYTFHMTETLIWTDAEQATIGKNGDRMLSLNYLYDPPKTPERIDMTFIFEKLKEANLE